MHDSLEFACEFYFFRDIFLEKHWRSIVSRSVCDQFFDAQTKAATPEDVPPIITANKNYLISIYREKIYLVAVTQMEGLFLDILICRKFVICKL